MEEFNNTFQKSGLCPVNFDGSLYTWTNGSVWERLDRAAVNGVWNEAYPLTQVSYLARGRSDHRPPLINCGGLSTARSSFRFLNVWKNHFSISLRCSGSIFGTRITTLLAMHQKWLGQQLITCSPRNYYVIKIETKYHRLICRRLELFMLKNWHMNLSFGIKRQQIKLGYA